MADVQRAIMPLLATVYGASSASKLPAAQFGDVSSFLLLPPAERLKRARDAASVLFQLVASEKTSGGKRFAAIWDQVRTYFAGRAAQGGADEVEAELLLVMDGGLTGRGGARPVASASGGVAGSGGSGRASPAPSLAKAEPALLPVLPVASVSDPAALSGSAPVQQQNQQSAPAIVAPVPKAAVSSPSVMDQRLNAEQRPFAEQRPSAPFHPAPTQIPTKQPAVIAAPPQSHTPLVAQSPPIAPIPKSEPPRPPSEPLPRYPSPAPPRPTTPSQPNPANPVARPALAQHVQQNRSPAHAPAPHRPSPPTASARPQTQLFEPRPDSPHSSRSDRDRPPSNKKRGRSRDRSRDRRDRKRRPSPPRQAANFLFFKQTFKPPDPSAPINPTPKPKPVEAEAEERMPRSYLAVPPLEMQSDAFGTILSDLELALSKPMQPDSLGARFWSLVGENQGTGYQGQNGQNWEPGQMVALEAERNWAGGERRRVVAGFEV